MKTPSPIIEYDIFRLNEYKRRDKSINWNISSSYTFLRYDKVDYFNYLFIANKSINTSIINDLIIDYFDNHIRRIKFIYPKGDNYKKYLDPSKKNKTILLCKNEHFKPGKNISNILTSVKTNSDLLIFTKIYLETFESDNKNYSEVASNFQLLLDSKKTDLFLIKEGGNIVGVCSNYYSDTYFLLSACGILNKYKNKGFQKKAINERLMIGKFKGYSISFAWTYEDSPSLSNLLRSGFLIEEEYEEALSKLLVDIKPTTEIL